MTAPLTTADFRARTTMPGVRVDVIERDQPGWIQTKLDARWSRIYSQLRKRYALAFDATSPPLILLDWLTDIVTWDCYVRSGFDPNSEQDAEIRDRAKAAIDEIVQAANSKDGMFDLPLVEGASASGLTDAAPLGTAQVTAYDWIDVEAQAINGDLSGFEP